MAQLRSQIVGGRAHNVILFLGDGMGDSEITIARNYSVGAAGHLHMDSLPLTGAYTTYALSEEDPKLPEYVTDSAASGTGWATGHKTSNGRISTVASSKGIAPMKTILEMAQAAGFKTGDITTAELTDATPAVLVSHVNNRDCEGPADMGPCSAYKKTNGGPGSIAEQTVDHHVDVLMGGGKQRFEQIIDGGPMAGHSVLDSAAAQDYRLVTNAGELAAAKPDKRLLGLFNKGNMTLEWSGAQAAPYPGSGPQHCSLGVREKTQEPSLAQMTTKAIALLEAMSKAPAEPHVKGAPDSSCRWKAHRSTSAITRRIPANRSVRP